MAVPSFIREPLAGMGSGLGRLVLGLVKATLLTLAAATAFVVLDRILLPDGIEDERERERWAPEAHQG